MKGVSENFKRIRNQYTIRTIFKTKHNRRRSLISTRSESDTQEKAQRAISISCEGGRSYRGETVRPLAVGFCEHEQNLKEGLQEESKLAQHA
jgi:hypothetical protein